MFLIEFHVKLISLFITSVSQRTSQRKSLQRSGVSTKQHDAEDPATGSNGRKETQSAKRKWNM